MDYQSLSLIILIKNCSMEYPGGHFIYLLNRLLVGDIINRLIFGNLEFVGIICAKEVFLLKVIALKICILILLINLLMRRMFLHLSSKCFKRIKQNEFLLNNLKNSKNSKIFPGKRYQVKD